MSVSTSLVVLKNSTLFLAIQALMPRAIARCVFPTPAKQSHDSHNLPFSVTIHYRWHPFYHQSLSTVGRKNSGAERYWVIVSPLDGTHYLLPQWMCEEPAEILGSLVDCPSLSIISLKQLAILLDKDLLKDKSFTGGHKDEKTKLQKSITSVFSGRDSTNGYTGGSPGKANTAIEPSDSLSVGRGRKIRRRRKPKGGEE
jgi:hypothetical protein